MGKIKDSNEKTHELNERQFNLLKVMNIALNYNELKNKIMSGFLYEIAINCFGYPEKGNLGFEVDLDKNDMKLIVRVVPDEVVNKAIDQLGEPE